ncbi:MAG: hypothetical protein KC646_10500 [Candidatus Cloacimonetes bacterium]|nr:hypothetical protein [Candidatus Cloacimonadota bacterium]
MRYNLVILFFGLVGSLYSDSQRSELQTVLARLKQMEKNHQELFQKMKEDMAGLSKKVIQLEQENKKMKNVLHPKAKANLDGKFVVKSTDGKHKFKIGGRLMNDWSFFSGTPGITTKTGNGFSNRTGFRRARIHLSGNSYGNTGFKIQYDFAKNGEVSLKETYLHKKLDNGDSFWVGHVKEPTGLENSTSSNHFHFMERSLLNSFYPDYNTGFGYEKNGERSPLYYKLGVFHDTDLDGRSSPKTGIGADVDGAYNYTGRMVWLPKFNRDTNDLLHVGATYSFRNSNHTNIRFKSTPESNLWANSFVDSGNILAEHTILRGLEFAMTKNNLSIHSEFMQARVKMLNSNPIFQGWYLSAGWMLTKEARTYLKGKRKFGRIIPNKNYSDGGKGAWEIAGRVSHVDLSEPEFNIRGGILDNYTLGLNWYMNPSVRIMLNHVWSELESQGQAKSLNLRFQMDF